MRTFVRHAVALAALAAMCQAGLALAEDFQWVSGGGRPVNMVGDEKVVEKGAPGAAVACCQQPCDACCGLSGCDACPPYGIIGFAGFDAFKGISDGDYQSNFGVVSGVNAAVPFPGLRDYGIGWQLGMSYGIYDFDGRTTNNVAESQQQAFVTTGFFRKAGECQHLSFGMVYDYMLNNNWGEFASAPTLGQWRSQVEWAFNDCNALGMWGCVRDRLSRQNVDDTDITTRPISQINTFWHHKFQESCANTFLWFGFTQRDRLNGEGSLGDWVVGTSFEVPVSCRLALYGNAQYMHPSAAASPIASIESDWNVGMGFVWYFGGNARSCAINGKCWLPYMPVANNSTFLVEQHNID
jgi:hypothetical protein